MFSNTFNSSINQESILPTNQTLPHLRSHILARICFKIFATKKNSNDNKIDTMFSDDKKKIRTLVFMITNDHGMTNKSATSIKY